MMDKNPYCSPAEEKSDGGRFNPDKSSRAAVARAAGRGVVFGGVIGGVGGIVILLTLRFWVKAPILMPGSSLAVQVVAALMAFAVIPSATVGAVGFGIRAIAERAKADPPGQ